MKPWMFILMAGAMWGLNVLYDLSRSSDDRREELAQTCKAETSAAGYSARFTESFCGCLISRASDWHDQNPDAEYTRELHQQIGMECAAGAPS